MSAEQSTPTSRLAYRPTTRAQQAGAAAEIEHVECPDRRHAQTRDQFTEQHWEPIEEPDRVAVCHAGEVA